MLAEFIGTRDSRNTVLPVDGFNMDTWREKSILGHGSLIAKSCKASMMLARHSEEVQFMAFKFGEHMSLAWKVKKTYT